MVARFLSWLAAAPAAARAEAAAALAHAFLHAELTEEDRAAATTAMTLLLDDPSLAVRRALAEGLAADPGAPPHIVLALARDAADVAAPILARAPSLGELDLVDLVALHGAAGQAAIARRALVPPTVAAALAAVGAPSACAVLVENPGAMLTAGILTRLVARHGADPVVREPLLARPDLPAALRQVLVVKLAEALTGLVAGRGWLGRDRAEAAAREACDRATLAIAARAPDESVTALVGHLRASRQLTPVLLLRAALAGQGALVDAGLAQLSGLPFERVRALVSVGSEAGLVALLRKAGLPAATHAAFAAALANRGTAYGDRLDRDLVEHALAAHCAGAGRALDPVAALLRRFAAEAAREEALDRAAIEAEDEIQLSAA
ncbi:MAG TPA: DUF2336 domain-containing protein [Hyphomicrobiales bacterium]|nr:DUF2336 domain-containing protein [Hyphomicrobiales bacterium]